MEIVFSSKAEEDLAFFIKSGNKSALKKITQILDSIKVNPKIGVGKPEQLKHELSSFWSRRIDREHRLIYKIFENEILVTSLKGHYK